MTHPVFAPGRTALITGAARGIGRAAARLLAAHGMKVVAVDLPGTALEDGDAPGVVAELVDVADWAAMQALADRVGPVDFLMNNAVTRTGRGMEAPLEDWRMAADVNFWGVVHGVRAFLPAMPSGGVIVNTGSKQGITNPPGHPIYNAMKAALKSYTESLAHDLRQGGDVTAHLLIPGWTMEDGPEKKPGAWTSDQVAEFMIAGVTRGDFYILCPDNDVTPEMDRRRVLWAASDITENRPPLSRWEESWAEEAEKACS